LDIAIEDAMVLSVIAMECISWFATAKVLKIPINSALLTHVSILVVIRLCVYWVILHAINAVNAVNPIDAVVTVYTYIGIVMQSLFTPHAVLREHVNTSIKRSYYGVYILSISFIYTGYLTQNIYTGGGGHGVLNLTLMLIVGMLFSMYKDEILQWQRRMVHKE